MFKTIVKAAILLVLAIILVSVVAAAFVYVTGLLLVCGSILAIAWALNTRFNVYENKKLVGKYTRRGGFERF